MEKILIISSALLWFFVLLNFLLLLAIARKIQQSPSNIGETLKIGTIAPPFRAKSMQDGKFVDKELYNGKSVAFVFIGIDCQPCSELMPHLMSISPIAKQCNVELVLVSESNADLTNQYLENLGSKFPVLIAERKESKLMEDYIITGTPWYYLINSKGIVYAAGHPGNNGEYLQEQIIALGGIDVTLDKKP